MKVIDSAGEHRLKVLVAETFTERAFGLAAFDSIDEDGMLFIRPVQDHGAFHMSGVKFPLLLAFFNSSGVLVDQVQLGPEQGPWRPERAFKYVLELTALEELEDGSRLSLG